METATNAEPRSRFRGRRQTTEDPLSHPLSDVGLQDISPKPGCSMCQPHSHRRGPTARIGITALRASPQALADGGFGVPSSRDSQLRQRSPCSRPAASAQQGHAEMPPGPDPVSPRDGLGKVPTTPNMPSWGSVFCGHVPWEPARVPAPELLGFLCRGGWEGCCPARSPAHLPPRRHRASGRFVSPQRSGSSRARRPRAEKPELVAEASGALWRLLGAERSHPGALFILSSLQG